MTVLPLGFGAIACCFIVQSGMISIPPTTSAGVSSSFILLTNSLCTCCLAFSAAASAFFLATCDWTLFAIHSETGDHSANHHGTLNHALCSSIFLISLIRFLFGLLMYFIYSVTAFIHSHLIIQAMFPLATHTIISQAEIMFHNLSVNEVGLVLSTICHLLVTILSDPFMSDRCFCIDLNSGTSNT